jgi:CBS domain-containing protein
MRVGDLCSYDVAVVTRDTNLARAGTLLRKYNATALPVVDKHDRVIGLITDRDVAIEVTRRNAPPSELFVDEILIEGIPLIQPQFNVIEALDLMARYGIKQLPVTDERDILQGIISIDDIIVQAGDKRNGRALPYAEIFETLQAIAEENENTQRAAWNRGRKLQPAYNPSGARIREEQRPRRFRPARQYA